MKIVVMLRALAPIVFRMAMSRCFSITSRISDATMFSAATMTMRPIVSEMAIFSSHERREERLVHVGPVLRDVTVAELRPIASATAAPGTRRRRAAG